MCCASGSVTRSLRTVALLVLTALAGCASAPEHRNSHAEWSRRARHVGAGAPLTTAPPPEPDKRAFRISIASVGDMMIGTDFPENHLPDDDGVSFLAAVTPVLSSADVAFGNLEGVLVDGGEPAKKCKNPNACYLFRSPTRYAVTIATPDSMS